MASGSNTDLSKEECTTPHYESTFLTNLYQFYQEGYLCDFTVQVDEKRFEVHKLALASCSDYFRAVCSHDMLEKRQEFVELKGLSAKGVEPLIKYAYTGTVELTLENIHDVINAATFLQITSAVELCITYLKKKMTFSNAEELLNIGEMLSIPTLKDYYRQYILDNFIAFSETECFLSLDAENLMNYLIDDKLRTPSEERLLQGVLNWYNHDAENREEIIHEVLDKIRYVIDGKFALEYALKTEPFISNPKCQEIIDFGFKYLEAAEKKYTYYDHRTKVRFDRKSLIQYGGVLMYDYDIDEMMFADDRGGWNKHAIYHADSKRWFSLHKTERQNSVSHSSVTEINDCAIIVGGYVYRYDVEADMMTREATKQVRVFYPSNTSFCDIGSLQHERAQHAAVYIPELGNVEIGVGSIYIIGGRDDKQGLVSVEKLDCHEGKWRYVKPLPKPLFDHAAAVIQGKIYVSGGVTSRVVSTDMWCYSPEVNKWHKKTPMNIPRAGHAMVSIDENLYVFGGYYTCGFLSTPVGESCLGSTEMFIMKTKQWTSLDYMLHPLYDISRSVCILDGKIIVAGGEDRDGELDDIIQQYDVEQNKWSVFGRLCRPLKGVGLCALTVNLIKIVEENKPVQNSPYNVSFCGDDFHAMSRSEESDEDEVVTDDDDSIDFLI